MGELNSPTQPLVKVFYLNTIAPSPDYGVYLGTPGAPGGKRLSLHDASGTSAFPSIDNGTIDFLSIQSPALNGQLYNANTAETKGVVNIIEPSSTLVANTQYGFWLYQVNNYTGAPIRGFIQYNTGGSNPIATGSATNSFYTSIINAGFQVTMTGQGTQTLVITAATGYPIIYANGLTNVTSTGNTTGIPSVGVTEIVNGVNLGDMNYLNTVGGQGNTFASYFGYNNTYNYDIYNFQVDDNLNNRYLIYILVNTAATGYSGFTTRFLETILELGGATPSAYYTQLALAPESPSVV